MTIDWLAIVPTMSGLAVALLLGYRIGAQRPRRGRAWRRPARVVAGTSHREPLFDQAAMLRIVAQARFTARPVLNQSEARVFAALEAECARQAYGWRVLAQVNLGEILASPDPAAFRAINSKRVDMLIVDRAGMPVQAVEYQGSGHHLGPAAVRDAVKKEALRRAGIGYAEIMAGDGRDDVAMLVRKLAERHAACPPAA